MQKQFFEPGAFGEFYRTFTEEMNRLHREHRTKLAVAPREIASINRRSKEIMELLLQGFRDEAWKEELRELEQRRRELEVTVANAETEPALPALHPQMAEVFRHKTEQPASALERGDEEERVSAREALRGFIDQIVIPVGDGLLQVVGDFGEMLKAAGGRTGSAAVAYVGCGARNHLKLEFSRTAAYRFGAPSRLFLR